MTSYLVSCPDCGHRFPVERDTMRAVRGSATGGNADAPTVWENAPTRVVELQRQNRFFHDQFIKNDPEPAA